VNKSSDAHGSEKPESQKDASKRTPNKPAKLDPQSREMLANALRKVIERYERKTGKRIQP
jgi:hypothetical protein